MANAAPMTQYGGAKIGFGGTARKIARRGKRGKETKNPRPLLSVRQQNIQSESPGSL